MKYLRILSFLIVSLGLYGAFVHPAYGQYEGYRHEGVLYGERLPNGVQGFGGGLVEDENYGVARYSSSTVQMLWLEKLMYRDGRGVPHWEVKDVLSFDRLPARSRFLLSFSSPCTVAGVANLNLVVLANQNPRTKRLTPLRAWMVNLREERFDEVSTQGVSCQRTR